jgi:putative DNA primase/helicase
MLDYHPANLLDNVEGSLFSELLASALGTSVNPVTVTDPNSHERRTINSMTTWFAAGNRLHIARDLARRTILCRLDSGQNMPEMRKGLPPLLKQIDEQRAELLAAVFTIMRAHIRAGSPRPEGLLRPAGFDQWSDRIAAPLMWLAPELNPWARHQELNELAYQPQPTATTLAQMLRAFAQMAGIEARASFTPHALTHASRVRRVANVGSQDRGRGPHQHRHGRSGGDY